MSGHCWPINHGRGASLTCSLVWKNQSLANLTMAVGGYTGFKHWYLRWGRQMSMKSEAAAESNIACVGHNVVKWAWLRRWQPPQQSSATNVAGTQLEMYSKAELSLWIELPGKVTWHLTNAKQSDGTLFQGPSFGNIRRSFYSTDLDLEIDWSVYQKPAPQLWWILKSVWLISKLQTILKAN